MPVMRSCEFYVFSSEGLAVSTFRQSSEAPLSLASRLPFSKEGVRMVRLSGSRGVRGEASQRQRAWWLKKSGGSLEERMRMFLRSETLLLRQWGSSSELSMQNYMLEIQLLTKECTPINVHSQSQDTSAKETQKIGRIGQRGEMLGFQGRCLGIRHQTMSLGQTLVNGWDKLNISGKQFGNCQLALSRPQREYNNKGMSGEKAQAKSAADKEAKSREEMLQAKKQIRILKEALLAERSSNRALEQQLYSHNERAKKMELQSKRREQKNEGLLLEIRSLKDALVAQRSEKQQIAQEIARLDAPQSSGAGLGSLFGLRGLFQR